MPIRKLRERLHQQVDREDAAMHREDARRRSLGQRVADVVVADLFGVEGEDSLFERPVDLRPSAECSAGRGSRGAPDPGHVRQRRAAAAAIATAARQARMRAAAIRGFTIRGCLAHGKMPSAHILSIAAAVERGGPVRDARHAGHRRRGDGDDQRRERPGRRRRAGTREAASRPPACVPERVDVEQRDRAPRRIVLGVETPALSGERKRQRTPLKAPAPAGVCR